MLSVLANDVVSPNTETTEVPFQSSMVSKPHRTDQVTYIVNKLTLRMNFHMVLDVLTFSPVNTMIVSYTKVGSKFPEKCS